MSDYISRDAAIEALRECVRAYPNRFYGGIEVARTAIIKLPSADVQPVIYCKDCKWFKQSAYSTAEIGICHNFCVARNENDYCSRAERREE